MSLAVLDDGAGQPDLGARGLAVSGSLTPNRRHQPATTDYALLRTVFTGCTVLFDALVGAATFPRRQARVVPRPVGAFVARGGLEPPTTSL